MDKISAVAAGSIASAAILAALISRLKELGLLVPRDEREIYEFALLLLEQQQGADEGSAHVFAAARSVIEQHLQATKGA